MVSAIFLEKQTNFQSFFNTSLFRTMFGNANKTRTPSPVMGSHVGCGYPPMSHFPEQKRGGGALSDITNRTFSGYSENPERSHDRKKISPSG